MQSIKTTTENYRRPIAQKKRAAPHPLSACADEIETVIPFTKSYGRGYWLRHLSLYQKRHRMEPETVYAWLFGVLNGSNGIATMDPKYSKGGTLTNKLKA